LAVLEDAARKGVRTYAFVGPLLPYLSDGEESLGPLLRALKDIGSAYFYVDRLNPRFGVWPSLKGVLQECFPHLVGEYRDILYHGAARSQYSERLRSTVSHLAGRRGLDDRIRLCF